DAAASRTIEVKAGVNRDYFEQWKKETGRDNWLKRGKLRYKYREIEKKINRRGYSLFRI
ncbi:MAG: hypothetical protein GY950_07135, partial [bacterium]|nr:hypothetical protein [bacterium]